MTRRRQLFSLPPHPNWQELLGHALVGLCLFGAYLAYAWQAEGLDTKVSMQDRSSLRSAPHTELHLPPTPPPSQTQR